ncbi:MAG: xanthine dehydrogenase family protein molybdopterin-binding subunit [Alphaproteobacteria bacterium]|jgi:CO/xanthine dehydrogenase Mo-binding subunit|nr:xanthine dehydrogenase family protein molybdopterin-binding subunit [Alphaproteobacteria bacterium]
MGEQKPQYKWVGKRTIRPDGADKVTGRAKFGADLAMPGMLAGKVLRSPHAHARIKSMDTSRAEALPGVKAVITAADMPRAESRWVAAGEAMVNYRDLSDNILAHEKVLYDGHSVAAVAATTAAIAEQALALIEVDYEVLPHVIDVLEAMEAGAPVLHDNMITEGVEPAPEKTSNVAKRMELGLGDVAAGFAAADVVVEREFRTKPVHQGYIEPHAAVASVTEDGHADVWSSSQGHFMVRSFCATLLDMDISKIKVTAAELGGGFGGKTTVYMEPLAILLSRKSGRPVRLVMSRTEVFRASGPTSGAVVRVKIGASNDGKITAGEATLYYQAGAYAGSPVGPGCMTAFAPYDLENVRVVGFDVVTNRPKVVAYRAPGAPISEYGVECVVDEIAKKLGIDPIDMRAANAAKEGTKAAYGPRFGTIGFEQTLEAAKAHEHYSAPLGPNQGRGVASGFWFNIGGESCAGVLINEDGTVSVSEGSPDVGGSRASMAIMTAEVLGIDVDKVKPAVVDTASTGYHFVTGGSRVTFATGMAVVQATEQAVDELRARAAKLWDVDVEGVVWEDGEARPASSNVGEFEPLPLAEIAAAAPKTGGPIGGHAEINATGAGPGFGTHICDVEVDPGTGHVTVLRYTAVQDVGRAIHPGYVEGQLQGGAAQGIGWALNEEYIYTEDGQLDNPGFLDYRIPVASDLPMIDTVLVEVPNPTHPFGVRGVGEVPIIPPMAAVANAIEGAIGRRLCELPMSPPKVLAAIDGGE